VVRTSQKHKENGLWVGGLSWVAGGGKGNFHKEKHFFVPPKESRLGWSAGPSIGDRDLGVKKLSKCTIN